MLLNSSQPESCITDNHVPPGYQTTSGEWVALTPELQLLRSPQEVAGTSAVGGDESTKTRGHLEPYQEGTLFRWAKYHQNQFRQRLMEQNLGPFALSIIGGHPLQVGSTTQEYREFLKALGPAKAKEQLPEISFFRKYAVGSSLWGTASHCS